MEIPELELELAPGTLGGLVTTVEGLLTNISQSKLFFQSLVICVISVWLDINVSFFAGLKRVHGFSVGDSAEPWKRNKWQEFDTHLQKVSCSFFSTQVLLQSLEDTVIVKFSWVP